MTMPVCPICKDRHIALRYLDEGDPQLLAHASALRERKKLEHLAEQLAKPYVRDEALDAWVQEHLG